MPILHWCFRTVEYLNEEIKILYVEQGLSRDTVAKKLGVPASLVSRSLRDAGIPLRPQKAPFLLPEIVTHQPDNPKTMILKGQPVLRVQIRLDRRIAYLVGWLLGDGSVNGREAIAILSSQERKIVEPHIRPVMERFGSVFVVRRFGCFLLRCTSSILARLLSDFQGRRSFDNVNRILCTKAYAGYLVAGLWDADGSVYTERSGKRIHLYNSNLDLLDKVAEALEQLYKISSTIYKRKEYAETSSNIRGRRDRFDLYVRAESNEKWLNFIGRHMIIPWKK